MSSPLASKEDPAPSQTPSALPPLMTESPDMAGPTQQTEEPRDEQVEAEQEHTPQPQPPVVEQATNCSTPKAEDSPEAHTADTSSTPAKSPDLPDMATPRSSISPGLESTPYEAGLNRTKRPHDAIAGPSPYERNKFVKLGDLFDEQVVAHFLAAASRGGQVSETSKTSYIAPVGTDEEDEEEEEEEEEEEMPTKKRTARKTGLIAETHIASIEPEEEDEKEEELPTEKRVARNAFDPTTLPRSTFDFVVSDESDGSDEEEMPTKRRAARKAGVTSKSSHVAFFGSDGEGEAEPPRIKGVARKVGVTRDALYRTWLSRSSSSVLETNKRSRAASVESDEEDDEEPLTKKRSTRKAGVMKDESPANLVDDPVVLEPTTLSNSSFDFETTGSTIYSKETSDPRKQPLQPPRKSNPATAAPSQPPTKSYLHLLPGELRNRIYTHLGLRSSRLNLNDLEMPSLMIAYPDLKSEMLSIMLSDNRLRVPVYSDFRIKASEAASHAKQPSRVRDFQVGTVAIDPKSWVMDIDPHFVTIKHIGLRILEVPNPKREKDIRLICDYFLNVRVVKGRRTTVSHKVSMMASTAIQRQSRSMCDLATARAKRFAEQDGFQGFTWKQVHEIAASFESVIEAQSHFTKKKGKVLLN